LIEEWSKEEGFEAKLSHWKNYKNGKQVTYLDVSWKRINNKERE